MLLFKSLEPKISKIYDTNGQDGPDTTYHQTVVDLDFHLKTSVTTIIIFSTSSLGICSTALRLKITT
jgi:hypothetical protein